MIVLRFLYPYTSSEAGEDHYAQHQELEPYWQFNALLAAAFTGIHMTKYFVHGISFGNNQGFTVRALKALTAHWTTQTNTAMALRTIEVVNGNTLHHVRRLLTRSISAAISAPAFSRFLTGSGLGFHHSLCHGHNERISGWTTITL